MHYTYIVLRYSWFVRKHLSRWLTRVHLNPDTQQASSAPITDDIVRVWNIRYQDAQLKNSLSFHLEPSGSNQSKPILNLFRPIKKMGTRKCTLRSFPNHKRQRRSRKTSFAAHHDKGIKVVARIFDLSFTALVTSHRVVTGSDDNYCTSLQHPFVTIRLWTQI